MFSFASCWFDVVRSVSLPLSDVCGVFLPLGDLVYQHCRWFHTYVEEYRGKHENQIMKISWEQQPDPLTNLPRLHNFGLFQEIFV